MRLGPQDEPFAGPLELSPEQCLELDELAMAIVHETLAEYDDFVLQHHRTVNTKRWRAVKSKENVTVYKQQQGPNGPSTTSSSHNKDATTSTFGGGRTPTGPPGGRESSSSFCSSTGTSSTLSRAFEGKHPRLLGIGRVVGSLEDAMYGIYAPDVATMRIRSSYVEDELLDSRVLYPIRLSTPKSPFQFLGVKWVVKAPGSSVTRARDLVYLEATGVLERPGGDDSVGYLVMHSIELPECPELRAQSVVRSRLSSCYILKQLSNGTVDVYMRSFMDPGGTMSERAAVTAAANTLIGCWRVTWCAQNKKLAYLMRESSAARMAQGRGGGGPDSATGDSTVGRVQPKASAKTCGLCAKHVSGFRTLTTCELCLVRICSRCLTARKLAYVRRSGELLHAPSGFCKTCITKASKASASEIAIAEYVPGTFDLDTEDFSQTMSTTSDAVDYQQQHQQHPHRHHQPQYAPPQERRALGLRAGAFGGTVMTPTPTFRESSYESERVHLETHNEWEQQQQQQQQQQPLAHHRRLSERPVDVDEEFDFTATDPRRAQLQLQRYQSTRSHHEQKQQHQQQQRELWLQMNQLCLAAEHTYRITKQNANAMEDVITVAR